MNRRRRFVLTVLVMLSSITFLMLLAAWLLQSSNPLVLKHWLQHWQYIFFSLRLALYSGVTAMWYSRVRAVAMKKYGSTRTIRTEVLTGLLMVLNEYTVWGLR